MELLCEGGGDFALYTLHSASNKDGFSEEAAHRNAKNTIGVVDLKEMKKAVLNRQATQCSES